MAEPDLYYVGIEPTVLTFHDSQVVIGPNTVVHRDSEIRAAYPSLFQPLTVHFDAPPPPEPKAKAPERAPEKATPELEKRATHTR